jgi:hypothetical protein
MAGLTDRNHLTSTQHVKSGKSRCKGDFVDLEKILAWFEQRDAFNTDVATLRTLTTGITATVEDGINCDPPVTSWCSPKQCTHQKIWQSSNTEWSRIKIDQKHIHIEPSVIFMRCTTLVQRESEDIKLYFQYDLSAIPTSLFKDYFMRKQDKLE